MAELYIPPLTYSPYKDHRDPRSPEEIQRALLTSTTLYIGNLSFYTTEEQIYEAFSKCGELKRIIMGLDRIKKTPCGFAFVEYYSRSDAEDCIKYLNGSRLDDRTIRVDWDPGFVEGRQYGRGKSGGQVRDEYRQDYDPGRGGFGKLRTAGGDDGSKKRSREPETSTAASGAPPTKRPAETAGKEAESGSAPEKNPRFREEHHSDEEEGN